MLANVVLALDLRKAKKAPVPRETRTITAEEILHDLTGGVALIKIERIDPSDVFLQSPRT